MKKLKHSKYKNTGLIFEILTRNIVNEILNKKSSTALGIVRKYFNENTELNKELKFYQTLCEVNTKIKSVDRLIDLVIETFNGHVDRDKINQEKYKLIGEIKNKYDFDGFFSQRVSNYKLLASVYKILEHSPSENPSDHMNCRDFISEHISGVSQTDNILTEVQTMWKTEDPDIKKLAFKIIVEKFNNKYQTLGVKQKILLKKFINEDVDSDTFRDYVYDEVSDIRVKLNRIKNTVDNKVMAIKINECVNLTEMIVSSKSIKNEHLSAMLKYYELIEELS